MFVFAAVMGANEPSNGFETNKIYQKKQQCSFCADSAPSQSLGLQSLGFRYADSFLFSLYVLLIYQGLSITYYILHVNYYIMPIDCP